MCTWHFVTALGSSLKKSKLTLKPAESIKPKFIQKRIWNPVVVTNLKAAPSSKYNEELEL